MNKLKTLILLVAVTAAMPAAFTPVGAQEQPPGSGGGTDDPGTGDPSIDDPGTDEPGDPEITPVADCPVKKTANFPVGGGNNLCLFQTEACGTTPRVRATGFHACDKLECSCTGNTCYGQNTAHPGSNSAPGLPIMANPVDIPWVVPTPTTLVQASAGQITTFGLGDYKVKYLKVLRLQSPAGEQFFALFKVFKGDDPADVGDGFEETDGYVGVRVNALTTPPAGGYLDLDSASATHFKKLPKFTNSDGTPGYVREAGAKLPIASGPSTAETWFHLFGTVL